MKKIQGVSLAILGVCMLFFGSIWYVSNSQSIGDVKIPSVPRQSCLNKNKEKHMKKHRKN